MSSDEEYTKSNQKTKPRRVTRACDSCRRKKIRCDGATSESNRCSNCNQYNYECTYIEAAKKRGPPKGYVESLEARLLRMESLLKRLCPDTEITRELGTHMDRETWYNERQRRGGAIPTLPPSIKQSRPSSPAGATAQRYAADDFGASDDDPSMQVPEDDLQQSTVSSIDRRFHGRSSGLVLVQTALDMKREYAGADVNNPEPTPKGTEFWANSSEWGGKGVHPTNDVDVVNFEFPPPDLMEVLIPHYFFHNNLYLPVLHRPTFERNYREGLHHRDVGFASVLLLVCAIAARASDDPRVLRGGSATEEEAKHSAGWKYFDQLRLHRRPLDKPATLYDLQQYALAAIFLQGSTVPYASWVMVGIGLRVAQDVGAHRKRATDGPMTVEDELWKRTFWVLVNLDRMGSAALGRPCAIHDEDFNLDLPIEVDDEYWENPNPDEAFKQPLNKPSTASYFIAAIKLDQMLSFTLRTIYAINKAKLEMAFNGGEWEQHILADLDTKLSNWTSTVPEHLRWLAPKDPVFFQQSALLYSTYYYIQILVHRPYISKPMKVTGLKYPSLVICRNAARSCSLVLDAQRRRSDAGPSPYLMFYAFTSGLVLLLDMWGAHKSIGPEGEVDTTVSMQDVHRCIQYLHLAGLRWQLAARLKEIIGDLVSVGDFSLPQASPDVNSNKRGHDSDNTKSAPVSEFGVSSETIEQPRPIVRPRSLMAGQRLPPAGAPAASTDFGPLPMNALDLASVPLPSDFLNPQQGQGQQQQPDAAAITGWFANTTDPAAAAAFDPQAQVLQLFGPGGQGGAGAAQMFSGSGPPFLGDFSGQQQAFPGLQPGTHDATLQMWEAAPSGFEWDPWANYIANNLMQPAGAPVSRPQGESDQQH